MKKLSRRIVLNRVGSAALFAVAIPKRANAVEQPHMQAAVDALKIAERELRAASSDKGGHRVRALRLVEQAIEQVERGIRFDRKN